MCWSKCTGFRSDGGMPAFSIFAEIRETAGETPAPQRYTRWT
jgi:hypothetical protein